MNRARNAIKVAMFFHGCAQHYFRHFACVEEQENRHALGGAKSAVVQHHGSDDAEISKCTAHTYGSPSLSCWAEARIKIARMTLTIKLDGNWSSFQLANSTPPLSVTDSAIAPSARMHCGSAGSDRNKKICGRGRSKCDQQMVGQCNCDAIA